MIGDRVDTAAILGQWTELMRLKASIETGAVVPSVILRKLAAAGAGNILSRALRALGRIERTLFTLQWLSDPALRQRSHAGLNKGEASNALRRAVFFHRQGEIRNRTFENQSFRASGLSLITAATFARHQFPPAIIRHAVWLYVRFTLSYRDVEICSRSAVLMFLTKRCGDGS